MVLDKYRSSADRFLDPLARRCGSISANALTLCSLLFSMVTVVLYYLSDVVDETLLLVAALTVFISSLLDALDGKVARIANQSSKKGDLYDHVGDRYADIFLIGGLFLTSHANIFLVFFAVTGVFMTSYMGTQAQALSAKRDYGGLLGRADRLVILIGALIAQYAFVVLDIGDIWEFSILEWMLILFAVLGHATALSRARSTARTLDEEERTNEEDPKRTS